MSPDPLVVVGDRFENFLAHHGTIPASELLRALRASDAASFPPVVVGQGVTVDQRAELARLLGAGDRIPAPVTKGLTHKHDLKNVMIGPPARLAEDTFVADLVVDERNETLEDHITGEHIPAVALIEAARQTWTAVTEQFLLAEATERFRFVVLSIGSRFDSYVFPLPTTVQLRLLEHTTEDVGQLVRCLVQVRQRDTVAAEVEGAYRLVPEAVSAKQEWMAARRAVSQQLREVVAATQTPNGSPAREGTTA